jgi:transcriptional regulator with XRE-family HTH domain
MARGDKTAPPPDTWQRPISASKLHSLRKARGFTLRHVAQHVGCSAQSVHAWERGDNGPAPNRLARLADLYEVAIEDMLEEQDLERFADKVDQLTDKIRTEADGNPWPMLAIGELREFDIRANTTSLRNLVPVRNWQLPLDLFLQSRDPHAVRIIRINHDPLVPAVYPGEYVLLDTNETEIHGTSGLYILCDGLTILIRFVSFVDLLPDDANANVAYELGMAVARAKTEPHVRLAAPNPSIAERIVPYSGIRILGAVIGKFSNLQFMR